MFEPGTESWRDSLGNPSALWVSALGRRKRANRFLSRCRPLRRTCLARPAPGAAFAGELRHPQHRSPSPWHSCPMAIDPRVDIGHVHLKVSDLDRALAFYCGVLGFELQ